MNRAMRALPGILALLCMCSFALALPASVYLPPAVVQRNARALVPPVYPGAEQIRFEIGVGSGIATEVTTYRAPAHISQVQSWMEKVMPGFVDCGAGISPPNPNCSTNMRCDHSWSSRLSTQFIHANSDFRIKPCVSVVLEAQASDDRFTIIRVHVGWPAEFEVEEK